MFGRTLVFQYNILETMLGNSLYLYYLNYSLDQTNKLLIREGTDFSKDTKLPSLSVA